MNKRQYKKFIPMTLFLNNNILACPYERFQNIGYIKLKTKTKIRKLIILRATST